MNQRLQNYLKVSVGNDTYNLSNYDKIQNIDTTNIKSPNTGGYLLQNWVILCNDTNSNNCKIKIFIRSIKTSSSTANSGAGGLLPTGDSFMYIETSSSNHRRERVFVSWERTDIIQITNITFFYKRFSMFDPDLRAMGRFRIQLLLEDNTWSTRYNIPKNDRFEVIHQLIGP